MAIGNCWAANATASVAVQCGERVAVGSIEFKPWLEVAAATNQDCMPAEANGFTA